MALANPFIVLSYVGGPAVLTSATSLLVLSTSNRFARAVDRSRLLSEKFNSRLRSDRSSSRVCQRSIRPAAVVGFW